MPTAAYTQEFGAHARSLSFSARGSMTSRVAAKPVPTDRYVVVVRGLELMCSIGIRASERGRLQRVRISVALTATDEATYPGGDRRRVINYEKVVAAIREIAQSGHIDLCEGFAQRITEACFHDPRVGHVRVEVDKLEVFENTEAVGAILERSRPA